MFKKIILVVSILIIAIFLIIFYFSIKEIEETKSISTKPTCSSSLSFSLSGNGTCNLTASISTENCNNKKYEIKNDDTKCSGTIKSDIEVIFCNWQVSFNDYTYNLYIDDELKDSRPITCPELAISCPDCQVCPEE